MLALNPRMEQTEQIIHAYYFDDETISVYFYYNKMDVDGAPV